jgi:Ca-activated chloride channel family protein
MSHARGLTAALVLAAVGAVTAAAQVFRSGVDTVLLNVTVADSKNHPLTGLGRDDFRVFEDGIAQEISVFASDPQPIALSLLLDSSTSMEDKLAVAQEAAVGFARRLGPRDVAQVINFNSETRIRQPFTGDVRALEKSIREIRPGGSTSLYTAMYVAIHELMRANPRSQDSIRRQAIVVLSDGEDTTSLKTYDDVAELAKLSDVAVYAIGLRDKATQQGGRGFSQADFALRTLSQFTGGRVFFVDDIRQLAGIYNQIDD